MARDDVSERIRQNLGLDEFEAETRPKIVSQLQEILDSLDDSKFYRGAREDLETYIGGWGPMGSKKTVGHAFFEIGDKLRANRVIPPELGIESVGELSDKVADAVEGVQGKS